MKARKTYDITQVARMSFGNLVSDHLGHIGSNSGAMFDVHDPADGSITTWTLACTVRVPRINSPYPETLQ